MLDELPVDAYHRSRRCGTSVAGPVRAALLAAQGRRMVVADVDGLVGALYRAGGRWLFTRPAVVLLCWWPWPARRLPLTWWAGAARCSSPAVLSRCGGPVRSTWSPSPATRPATRSPPNTPDAGAAGFLVYFIPSVFVDTTDVWMAGTARLLTTAAGPATGLVLAGAASLAGLVFPAAAPWTFKLAVWYLTP